MGLGIPPLKIKIVLESNPPKPTMLVGRLCVLRLHNQMHLLMIFPRQSRQVPRAADPWRRCGHWRSRSSDDASLLSLRCPIAIVYTVHVYIYAFLASDV